MADSRRQTRVDYPQSSSVGIQLLILQFQLLLSLPHRRYDCVRVDLPVRCDSPTNGCAQGRVLFRNKNARFTCVRNEHKHTHPDVQSPPLAHARSVAFGRVHSHTFREGCRLPVDVDEELARHRTARVHTHGRHANVYISRTAMYGFGSEHRSRSMDIKRCLSAAARN